MGEKLTLRDLIIFFVSGFLFTAIFFITFYDILYDWFFKQQVYNEVFGKLDTGILIAIGIPSLYIIGHFVHAVDSIIFEYLGRPSYKLKRKKNNSFFNLLNYIFNYHRVTGLRDRYWLIKEDLQAIDIKCSVRTNLYSEAKYWSFLNDTFKAYVLIFGVFMCIAFLRGNLFLGLIYTLFLLLFRKRGRLFGRYYLESLTKIYKLIIEPKSKNYY